MPPVRKHGSSSMQYQYERKTCWCKRCKGSATHPKYTVRGHMKKFGRYEKPAPVQLTPATTGHYRTEPFARPPSPAPPRPYSLTPAAAATTTTSIAGPISFADAGTMHGALISASAPNDGIEPIAGWFSIDGGIGEGFGDDAGLAMDIGEGASTGAAADAQEVLSTLSDDSSDEDEAPALPAADAYTYRTWTFDTPALAPDPGHRGAILALRVISYLFADAGLITEEDCILSLTTAMLGLGLADTFLVLPMCPTCGHIIHHKAPKTSVCPGCSSPMFASKFRSNIPGLNHFDDCDFKPKLKFPFFPISSHLVEILGRDGLEEMLDLWRLRERKNGELLDITDGEIWKTLKAHDGSLFFDNRPDRRSKDELRIRLMLAMDGFSHSNSRHTGSHSSDVLSCSIANLPIQFKCRPRNLMLCGVYPGPKAPTSAHIQHILKPLVDDLLRLYEEGIVVKTPKFPQGRRVRAVLVAICCDHPALCKACGFADHSHRHAFCFKCKIPRSELKTEAGMTFDAFEARTSEEYRALGLEYLTLHEKQRKRFFKAHGVRYTEFARLRYFDLVRMVIVDPMHNILLGIIKSLWLNSWIQTGTLRERTSTLLVPRELDLIHAYLREFEMPSWVGRLPSQVGYAAGGSLTADEYKALAVVFLPIIIPFVWAEWQPVAQKQHEDQVRDWENKGKEGPRPIARMIEDDADVFLNLAAALKAILARSVNTDFLPAARAQLSAFLLGYLKNHKEDVKPNFHWVTHVFDQICDFGPVYGFWSFTTERLNKVMKSYKTNGHDRGELEVTFMREFLRDVRLREIVSSLARGGADDRRFRLVGRLLLESENDTRGTIASMGKEIDDAARDLDTIGQVVLGTSYNNLQLDATVLKLLHRFYKESFPGVRVFSHNSAAASIEKYPNFLNDSARHHKFLVMNGRRIIPSADIYSAPNAIVQTHIGPRTYAGQVMLAFTHRQPGVPGEQTLLYVKWFCDLRPGILNADVWRALPALEVGLWEFDTFLPPTQGPSRLIPPEDIDCQACRVRIIYREPRTDDDDDEGTTESEEGQRIWVTVGLTKDTVAI